MAHKTKSFICSPQISSKALFITNTSARELSSSLSPAVAANSSTHLFHSSPLRSTGSTSKRAFGTNLSRNHTKHTFLSANTTQGNLDASLPPIFCLTQVRSHKPLFTSARHFHSSTPTAAAAKQDFYETLGVSRTASQDEIKSAYHKMAMKYHPDKNPNDKSAEERLQTINQAYSVLKDEEKRRQYDQFGAAAFEGGGPGFDPSEMGVNMQDILSELFNMSFGGKAGGQTKSRGDDIELPLRITFQEAVNGCEKVVTFRAKSNCNTCHGSGAQPGTAPKTCTKCNGRGFETMNQGYIPIQTTCRTCGGEGTVIANPCNSCKGKGVSEAPRKVSVQIPAGVDDGMSIRLVNQGDAGVKGGRAGHLYIKLSVPTDEVFKREGSNVHTDIPISISQAVLGGTVRVPTLAGQDVEIKIPPGTQPDEKRVLRGKGIPMVSPDGKGSKAGNHYIHFKIKIPTHLTPKQKEAMEQFAKDEKKEDVRRYARENPGNPYSSSSSNKQQKQQQQQYQQQQQQSAWANDRNPMEEAFGHDDEEEEDEEGGGHPFWGRRERGGGNWHRFDNFFRKW